MTLSLKPRIYQGKRVLRVLSADPPEAGQTGLRVPGLRAGHPQGVSHPGGLPLPPLLPGHHGAVSRDQR